MGNKLNIAKSQSKFDLLEVGKGVYTGEQLISFPVVVVNSDSQSLEMTLEDIAIASNTQLIEGNISSTTGLSAANITSPLPLNSVDWKVALNGLTVKGFEQYLTAMNKVSNEDWSDTSALETELKSAFAGLASTGAEITNKLTLTNDGGDVVGNINLAFQGDGTASGSDSIKTVGDLLRAINITAEFNADAMAIDMTPAAMIMMHPTAQQFIVSDGEKYSSAISVTNLILDVNGNLQPLEPMLGDELNQPLSFSSAMTDY